MKIKQNWDIRNNYSYAATATKIQFHFQFPRSDDAVFGGHIGWFMNWKFKFCGRIISDIPNHVRKKYFWDDDGIDNVPLRLWKLSDFCSRHTVGVAGDDIMYHILVIWCNVGRHRSYIYLKYLNYSPLRFDEYQCSNRFNIWYSYLDG